MANLLQDFQIVVEKHSLFPGKISYNGNALAGEVGEVCNIIKKIEMARENPDWVKQDKNPLHNEAHFQEQLKDELGDALFYLRRVAMDFGFNFTDLMKQQIIKLADQSEKYQRTFLK